MELNRRPVASLWIGENLNYINQLCLKSHLLNGHPVTLYCTDQVVNLPQGVVARPASEIMEISAQSVKQTSASFWSNVFRYKMIEKTGAIWIDCDAFCHKPFPDDAEWIFAGHGMRGALNCGVVGLPRNCELMDALLDYYDNLPAYPPWWNRKQRAKMDQLPDDMPHATKIYKTERTAFGPQAFTHFAKVTGNMERAMPSSALYPVPFQLVDAFFDPYGCVEGWMRDDTMSVHLYTNGTKPYWQKNPPLPNSYVARMCEEVGIDPRSSLNGGPCDIDGKGRSEPKFSATVQTQLVGDQNATHSRIDELEQELQKQKRRGRRKAMNAKADGMLQGVCAMLKPGDLAIDLGANVGDVSARLLETGADVIGFDPEPWAIEQIRDRLGDHPNYTFHNAAVGTEDGKIRLFRASNFDNNEKKASVKSTTMSGGRMIAERSGDGVDVTQIDFIAFAKDVIAQRGSITFLKMDIEGMELELLEKMDEENLFDSIRYTVVETHEHKFRELRPRFRAMRARFSERYKPSHVSLDWK